MTILITNLEDCLEDISDDEMQQLSGGISISFDVSLLDSRNSGSGQILQDVGIGAGAAGLLASLGQWYELIYLPGLNRTRRIVGREPEEVV